MPRFSIFKIHTARANQADDLNGPIANRPRASVDSSRAVTHCDLYRMQKFG